MRRSRKIAEKHRWAGRRYGNKKIEALSTVRNMTNMMKDTKGLIGNHMFQYCVARDLKGLMKFTSEFKRWLREQ